MRIYLGKVLAVPLALACLLVAAPATAGNGKIAGVVKDDSGQVLPGANVVTLVGSEKVGAITDEKGRYFLLNIPEAFGSLFFKSFKLFFCILNNLSFSDGFTTFIKSIS